MDDAQREALNYATGVIICLVVAASSAWLYSWLYVEWGWWGIFWGAFAGYILNQIIKSFTRR